MILVKTARYLTMATLFFEIIYFVFSWHFFAYGLVSSTHFFLNSFLYGCYLLVVMPKSVSVFGNIACVW